MLGHKIEISLAPGRVRVELDGEVVAESGDALVLAETGSPPRYYLPREDVGAELRDSDRHTHCPFKGEASYHSIGEHPDIAWYYPEPKDGVAAIRDRVAFYNDRVEISVA
jgi:uncharacterized protein (DUF427 family)